MMESYGEGLALYTEVTARITHCPKAAEQASVPSLYHPAQQGALLIV